MTRHLPLALVLLLAGAARGADGSDDPDDPAVWPNRTSRANSDPWLATNHDGLKAMRPRVLVINFSNLHPKEYLERMTARLIAALAEGSRYHGYADPKAPAFLNYRLFKFVDLRDNADTPNSARLPLKKPPARFNVDYKAFFNDEFAKAYGVPHPTEPNRFLKLGELLDGGYVHEVWFFAEHVPGVSPYESVERKPVYDEKFARQGDKQVQAGNGGDPEMPWTGRSVRIGFINASRGIGCFLESLSHSMEGTSNSKAIPYFTRYFAEYAGLDLDRRHGLPFASFYACDYSAKPIRFPKPDQLVVTHRGKDYTVNDYTAAGGNAHFPPNGRWHYDLDNDQPVRSTIEDWRIGSGPGGADLAKPWTNAAFRNYRDLAPDCMGPWLVYWRQNMPGLDNKSKDAAGRPMKNWWPFLFY